ncbi:MAG: hypothetical protein K1X29_06035 [Bdellovibrionales bacterium]|nr:hypothetical protein [Bdellovibrionales bacterium]
MKKYVVVTAAFFACFLSTPTFAKEAPVTIHDAHTVVPKKTTECGTPDGYTVVIKIFDLKVYHLNKLVANLELDGEYNTVVAEGVNVTKILLPYFPKPNRVNTHSISRVEVTMDVTRSKDLGQEWRSGSNLAETQIQIYFKKSARKYNQILLQNCHETEEEIPVTNAK